MKKTKAPVLLDLITDKVLAYQPVKKQKVPKKRLPKPKKKKPKESTG